MAAPRQFRRSGPAITRRDRATDQIRTGVERMFMPPAQPATPQATCCKAHIHSPHAVH
jgi:hypothetical protein